MQECRFRQLDDSAITRLIHAPKGSSFGRSQLARPSCRFGLAEYRCSLFLALSDFGLGVMSIVLFVPRRRKEYPRTVCDLRAGEFCHWPAPGVNVVERFKINRKHVAQW